LDYLVVTVRGGKGGQGAASFGLAKSGGMGAPSGGNGGNGGRVFLTTSTRINSLASLPRTFHADPGGSGGSERMNGQRGKDIYLTVPVGTVIREEKTC
jgi:GTP-binding protein